MHDAAAVFPSAAAVASAESGMLPPNRRQAAPTVSSPAIRALDIFVAVAAIVLLAPVLIMTALVIWASRSGPVLFRQQRIGLDGEQFTCLKFRTMRQDADTHLSKLLETCATSRQEWELDQKLRKDPRVTPFGSLLRRSSIDELPQLFNVLAGEMSIVGPRPIVASEAVRYGRYIRYYYSTRPGITGIWQISGRNNTSYRRRIACDVLYSRSQSVATNLKIILGTVPVVLKAHGAY